LNYDLEIVLDFFIKTKTSSSRPRFFLQDQGQDHIFMSSRCLETKNNVSRLRLCYEHEDIDWFAVQLWCDGD